MVIKLCRHLGKDRPCRRLRLSKSASTSSACVSPNLLSNGLISFLLQKVSDMSQECLRLFPPNFVPRILDENIFTI